MTTPGGAWELPDELVMLRDTVRRFMEREVRPLEDTLGHDAAGLPDDQLRALQGKARAAGLWSLQTPAELGGAGLSVVGQVVVQEEAAQCRMGAFFPALGAFGGNPPSVLLHATDEQFDRYARPIIEGSPVRPFTAISEPAGGSDPARAIQCRAVRHGDHYVVNGTKLWTTHATAEWGILYARTGAAGAKDAISCFIVPTDTPGLSIRPLGVMTSYSPSELHFEDAIIPADNRIGKEGQGFELAREYLVRSRIPYTAVPIGIATRALHLTIEWVKERQTFGAPLASRQGVQWMIADSEIELRAARLLVYQAAWKADRDEDVRVEASIAKLNGTETAFRILDRCVQLHGALGMSEEAPFERWFRELRVKRLGEGASEVLRTQIGRALLE